MLQSLGALRPQVHPTAFVHSAATLIGEVELHEEASVWPGASLRGDEGLILVGARSNVQDNCTAHATGGRSTTVLGPQVTVGHGVVLHGCHVAHDCIVGMGSVLMDDAEIGPFSIVGAGALVPPGKRFPEGVLILGSPARVAREITEAERGWIEHSWREYLRLSRRYREAGEQGA